MKLLILTVFAVILATASASTSFLESTCPQLCTSDDGRTLCAVRYNPFKSGPAPTTKFANTCDLVVYNCRNPTAPLVLLNYGECR